MKKIKICYFCELWASGGIESFLSGIIENLDTSLFTVDIIAAKIGDSIFTEPLKAKGVSFYGLSGKLRSPGNYPIFKRLLKENGYDVIHFNVFQAFALSYVKIAKDMNVPVRIVHAHGAGLRRSATRPLKMLLHRLSRAMWSSTATATLACSQGAARFFFGKDADEIIKNGIDTDRFSFSEEARAEVRRELGIGDELLLGYVARLSSEKNQSLLLKAFTEVVKARPDARLLLVGDGPDKDRLVSRASALGIYGKVIFYGTTQKVPEILSAMDIFVFPSLSEGLGIVALEAQASGLPTICSSAIPHETAVTDLVKFVDIKQSPEHWASEIVKTADNLPIRRSRADEIRLAGFDADAAGGEVAKYYRLPSYSKELE